MKFKIIILSFILFAHLYGYTGAGSRYGYSARSFALSDAMVADEYHTFQSFSNPSSLNQCDGSNYGISFFNMSLNRSIQTFYFSKGLPGNAGLSLAILRSGVSDFMGKDSFNNPTNHISMSDYYGLLSFGLKGFGLSIKMHYSNLHVDEDHTDRYSGNSIILDFGWSTFITDQFKFAFKVENIINPYLNWDIDIADGFSHSYSEDYPLILSIGLMYKINQKHRFLTQFDKINLSDGYLTLSRFGYEYNLLKNYFIRLGLKGDNDFRLGFGYIFNINDTFPLMMDYSLDLGSENEGISHLFTWSFNL
tara:strand:+ start:9395 stop:10312 length:918 start_codon:yes stop_codon:yes gene_type:complete